MLDNLKSEDVVVAAPMSYAGSLKRIVKMTKTDKVILKWLLIVPTALLLILTAWVLITIWYLIFGILVIPYRLLRRSQRKEKRDRLRHRELLQQINKENQ